MAVRRMANDDGQGGAHNNRGANLLTFHGWHNPRDLTAADCVTEEATAELK